MKKLLTALLCLALLAQLTVPVWAEDDLVIEIEQEAPSQDELEDISEDLTVDMDEADASFIEQMDDVSLDESLDIEGDLEKPEDMEILAGDIEDNAGAIESNRRAADDEWVHGDTLYIPDGVETLRSPSVFYPDDWFSDGYEVITSVSIPGSWTGTVSYGSYFDKKYFPNLKHVTIRDGMKQIPEYMFKNCTLETITLPTGLEGIGRRAFEDCENLRSITIPPTLKLMEIGEDAFWGCSSLESVHLPDIVDSNFIMGNGAFRGCINLKDINLPMGMKTISESLFIACSSLETINIPKSVETIGVAAFNLCRQLTNVDIPNSVTYIGDSAFSECDSLAVVKIPDSCKYIGNHTFYKCVCLKEVSIPGSVKELGEIGGNEAYIIGPFQECKSLTNVTISEGVEQIGDCAFASCEKLENIIIPSSIKRIGMYAFDRCNLKGELTVSGDLDDYAFYLCMEVDQYGNGGLDKFIIRNGTKKIGFRAMPMSVKDVYIPESVEYIYELENDSDSSYSNFECIHGKTGSYAEKFARKIGKRFIDDSIPTSIALNKTGTVNLTMGKTLTLKATVEPSTAETTLTWKSSDPKIAKVSKKGVVTALKKGEANITVTTDNGLYASVVVNVVPPKPTSVTITNGDKATLYMGNKLTLKAKLEPKKSESTLTWKSSKPKVAEVSEKGVVTPKKAGTAVITVKTANGKKDSITVTVVDVKSVKLKEGKAKTLKVGKKLTLHAIISPSKVKTKLTWTSSDKKVATVSSKGVVKAIKPGKAKITVKTANGKKATVTITVKKK